MLLSRSNWRRAVRRHLEPIRKFRRQLAQAHAGRLFVDLHAPWLGFFAQLEWVLEILCYAEDYNRRVQIRLTGPQYVTPSRGADFLRYFFEPAEPDLPLEEKFWHRVGDINELGLPKKYDSFLAIDSAGTLLFRHYRFREDVLAEFESLASELLGNASALGIHYRGTDKTSEADRVPPEEMLTAIEDTLSRMPADVRLFVATDEQAFLNACITRFGSRAVSLPDYRRSTNDQPVHRDRGADGYYLARDALFNCLMLSRCRRVLKTASILSSWAKVFEPSLEIHTLSRRRGADSRYFPERCIPDYVPKALTAGA